MMYRTALAATFLILAACGTAPPADGNPTLDGAWRLVGGVHNGDPIPLPDGAPITMTVEDGQVGGRAACNQYSGEIRVDGDGVLFGALVTTEMACDEPIMAAEAAYHAALADVERWERAGETLTLSGEVVELTYELTDAP